MRAMLRNVGVMAAILGLTLVRGGPNAAAQGAGTTATQRTFTVVAVQIDKAKFWLPSTIEVEQGDDVKLVLKNMIPGEPNQHGFSIPAYGVTELVTRGQDKTVEFNAARPGIFPFICQVHPPHIGGQLVVHTKTSAY